METEKASHETEESLILAQLSAAHQTDPLIAKLQNGDQSPPQQLNGDANWNHFKPSVGVNPMKRYRENCSSPAVMQDLFDQGPYGMNGEMKHALSEQSLLGLHQPKKLRADLEMNGEEVTSWDKKEPGGGEDFPELTKSANFEPRLEKRNCNFPNGDIFSLSRNKLVPIPNGAIATPPSMEGTPGALLEKTLSQYYPEHVSIALQTGSSQADGADLAEQATHTPSLTSGFPISSQMSASEHQARIFPEGHSSNGYNAPFMVNGYSGNFGAEHQQQQPYPLQDLPALEEPHALGQGPAMASPVSIGDSSQNQNGTECFPSNPEGVSIFSKPNQEFSQDPYLPPMEQSTPLPTEDAGGFSSFTSPAGPQAQSTQKGQQHLQYGQQQSNSTCASDGRSSLQGPLCSAQPAPPQQRSIKAQTAGSETEPRARPTAQQTQRAELENELSLTGQAEGTVQSRADPCSQMGWIDLNSAQPPQPAAGLPPHIWRGFPPQHSPPEQQQQTVTQGHALNPTPAQGFQTQGYDQPGFPPRDCQTQDGYKAAPSSAQALQHNSGPEWQQTNSKNPSSLHGQLSMPPGKLQHMAPLCGLSQQQQAESPFCAQMEQEHLCKGDPDLEQILSPGFLQTHPQYEGQQGVSALQHQPPQDTQRVKMLPQPQDPSQGQLDTQLLNRLKMESYLRAENQLKSPTYRAPKQILSSPSIRSNASFGDPSRPNSQPPPNDMAMFGYGNADGGGMQESYKFNKVMEMQQQQQQQQQQRQYTPSPGAQKQYTQQPHNHRLSNHMDFPQPPPTQQPQPQLAQGALGPQVPVQMYPKLESLESCAQFQRGGPLMSPGAQGDFQRHAALRLHLLQRQERHGLPPGPNDLKHALQNIKREPNGPRFEPPAPPLLPPPPLQQQARELANGMQATVKQEQQEQPATACKQSQLQRSILATMEQQLRQYQLSPVFERKSLVIKSPNKVKVEMGGVMTVLSTNADMSGAEEQRKPPEFTPTKKELGLDSFLESPMKLLDTPIKNLLDTPIKTQYDIAPCHCVEQISEKDEGPYYTHLGAAPNIAGIREKMEKRSGLTGSAIRIEKVVYTGKEGKSTQGCPIAKWVIRRSSVDEKLLVLVRERTSHSCETACIVVVILVWEGIAASLADHLYMELSDTLRKNGALTNRRCALNEERTCACQGLDTEACGASFSFGCSWSMYYNGCKFARSKIPRKFKLLGDEPKEEEKLESNLQNLATLMAPTYKRLAPDAYANQVEHENRAPDCRLGRKEGRPFSGVTACLDFCAHAHRDLHNMQGGSTVVCTLTREDNREIGKIAEDEQLHVLPLYKASSTDEFGSAEAQLEKTRTGAIQVLSNFRRQVRMLAEPAKSCRQKKLDAKRAAANKPSQPDTPNSKTPQAKLKQQSTYTENPGQNTPVTGPHPGQGHIGAHLQPGNPLGAQQQQNPSHPYPGSPHAASYPRFPNTPGLFPSTSKPANMFPQPPTSASPYPTPLHVPNSYINGSSPTSPYPGSLMPNLYPGYQCNGGMPMENYHPYYGSNPKHLDMYRQQRPLLYAEQQYAAHQRYGVSYPPRYGDPGLQVNGYSNCSMRPSVHPMGPYPSYSPNGAPDPQFLEAISRPPSAHPGLDYAAVSKGNQFGGYPSPYLAQSPQMFPPDLDPLRMQSKLEMNLHGVNGITQVLPPQGGECRIPNQPPGFCLPNGSLQGSVIKQEPGVLPPPAGPKEDVWSDNEHNFLDPEIGGVAVAPSHGSILIECAKRELHATTPIKQPDRNHPTRISLVFYQHKNMNEAKHGLALWEAKMAEKAREKEEDAERNGGESTPVKSSGGKKVKREPPETSEHVEPPYKRFIQMLSEKSMSCTTNTYVGTAPYAFTKVTGPYNCFL